MYIEPVPTNPDYSSWSMTTEVVVMKYAMNRAESYRLLKVRAEEIKPQQQ